MFKKLSLRWRMTIMTALLLSACCIGLTLVLNHSTFQLANSIEAATTTPAIDPNSAITNDVQPMMPLLPAEQTQQAIYYYQIESILFMIVAVLLGSSLTYYVSGHILEPVNKLNKQVKKLSVINLSETLDIPPANDEIAELTQSFNEMTDKLHEAFSMQQRFSSNAAHELRTPLTVLQTKIDVFHKKEQHTTQEYEALVSIVQKQTTRLRSLIKNLLDMTNMEDDIQQKVILYTLFEDILNELSVLAEERQVSLSIQCGNESIIGNPELLYRAFYNIVENAIKYNVVNGNVQVHIEKNTSDKFSIHISDTGIGIPDDSKKYIFTPFYRVEKSRSRAMGGAGLGLSIVDKIIQQHGGTISITDVEPQGTCFRIDFNKNT